AAIHSVRAVPASDLRAVADWADGRGAPLHVHLSEQRAENDACQAAHSCTPAELLHSHGVLGAGCTAVHATHLSATDIALLGSTATMTCLCPTTERDLADGIGPALALSIAGSPLALGSDSHAVIDILEEARAVELDQRLAGQIRGNWSSDDLLTAATVTGHRSLGWPEAGRIEVGGLADFVTLRLDSVRTAGADSTHALDAAVFAATAADITEVVVAGRLIVEAGRHVLVADVPAALRTAIANVT
ncbi:MAG: amidohydrolase family protein, partial [Mycobacteriales bacterium]